MAIVNLNCGGGGKYKNVLASLIDRSITEIEIPEGVTTIGDNAFYNCRFVTKIVIPDSVTTMGYQPFSSVGDKVGIDEVIIPDSVTNLGANAFIYSGVKKFIVSKNTTSIPNGTFQRCARCVHYDFTRHEAVPTLESISAFNAINSEAKILVPKSLYDKWIVATNWAEYADHIVGVRGENDASEGLEMILSDDGTYYQVAGMGECTDTDVIIPSEYNGLPVKAFYNGIAHEDFDGVFTDDDIVSITVPDSITDFDVPFAVFFCNSLKMLNLGSGVTINEESIPGHFTIMGNSSLEKITVSENNPYLYTNESGTCLFTGDGALLISLDGTIPDGTVTICDYVFENGAPVTNELKMPPSVAKIGQSLFFAVWDFSNHTFVPSLSKNTGNPKKIIVPAALLYEWKNATNWCEFADVIVAAE